MRVSSTFSGAVLVAATTLGAFAAPPVLADRGQRVEVTITNVTGGQIISPVVVATHSRAYGPLFRLGEPASEKLAGVAEDAAIDGLIEVLEADPAVHDVGTVFGLNDVILPGESASVVVRARGFFRQVSVVGMLVTTNDAFTSVRDLAIPRFGSRSVQAVAYDAGSEVNNEDCDFIPGPPCGSPGVRDQAGAEGFVHVHSGVHGGADLDPATHDWRNPVAIVTVRRVSGSSDD